MTKIILMWFMIFFSVCIYPSDGYDIKFHDEEDYEEGSGFFTHYHYNKNECVNLNRDWAQRIMALELQSKIQCVTLYTQAGCQGDFVNIHQLAKDYRLPARGHNLIDSDFHEKAVSFADCDSVKVKMELSARPTFYFRIYDGKNRDIIEDYRLYTTKADECVSLPPEWQNRISSVDTLSNCYVLYDSDACSGRKKYLFADSRSKGALPWEKDLTQIGFNDIAKSFKTCDIAFHAPCKTQCPKFLYGSSVEYKFWMYFLSINSPFLQNEFTRRVTSAKDGFISWDFLLPSDWVSSNIGHQYLEAMTSQRNILRALIRSDSQSSFKVENLKTLLNLTRAVKQERLEQLQKFKKDYNDPNFAVMSHIVTYWASMEWTLNEIIVNRYLEAIEARLKVTFYKDVEHRSEYKTYAYNQDTCVNLDPGWVNKTSSLEIYDQCITLYSKSNCKGEATNVHQLTRGHSFLSAINFDDKVASFKECQPTIEIRPGSSPNFYLPINDKPYFAGQTQTLAMKSGECRSLPKGTSVLSLAPDDQCYVLFDGIKCSGKSLEISLQSTASYMNLEELHFDKTKSIKTCDLMFQTCSLCPDFIVAGNYEYNFWLLFFSVSSSSQRSDFAKRVESSKNGLISWDFLFSAKTSARSLGDQYQEALESQRNIIRALSISRPGKWGFNTQNVETLHALALAVHQERDQQVLNYYQGNEEKDHNYKVMKTVALIWKRIESDLKTVLKNWHPENIDDTCGVVESEKSSLDKTSPLISDGLTSIYGDDPWHAAIYRKLIVGEPPNLICGASLISRTVLVSAAHCFYDERLRRAMNDTTEYEIALGKFTRDYKVQDPYQKIHQVKEFIFGPRSYNPTLTGTYGSDIILIILTEPTTFNQYIRSVCLDWNGSIFGSSSNNEIINVGRVVGWGGTSKDDAIFSYGSQYLLKAELPYISQKDCVGKLLHLTNDNFCGGAQNGPALRKGDSGGGFVFKFKNKYYLRGIVSTRDKNSNSSISAFTDVGLYVSWIKNYL